MKPLPSISEQDYDPYQLLRVYTYYRLFLGSLLLLVYQSNLVSNVLGSNHPALFLITCGLYFGINILSLISIWRNRTPPNLQQCFFAVFIDIVAITIFMYASGGATSGLGYLLLVSVAAAGMLLPAQLAIFSAALATIALISESLIQHLTTGIDTKALFIAGSLGTFIFLTAFTFQYITRKIRKSSEEVRAQLQHVAHLQKLARLIVERMRTGIMVLNENNDIELINKAAKELLMLDINAQYALSINVLPDIAEHIQQWQKERNSGGWTSTVSVKNGHANDLRLSLTRLEMGADNDTLIFVEDNRALAQQAQQLKLASLGRLTASIAHEIRNPLGAISHATQLLSESSSITSADQRLLEIIGNHTQRVNQIIENIFQVSRRRLSDPQLIEINTFLESFIDEYKSLHKTINNPSPSIALHPTEDEVFTRFDNSQLQQIITNLMDNALRYTNNNSNEAAVTLETGIDNNRLTPYLKIIDNGPGITQENQKHVFEPFFTTESSGSGLGLFICKELCEANQAVISYSATEGQPSCFTIQFAHPEKTQQ